MPEPAYSDCLLTATVFTVGEWHQSLNVNSSSSSSKASTTLHQSVSCWTLSIGHQLSDRLIAVIANRNKRSNVTTVTPSARRLEQQQTTRNTATIKLTAACLRWSGQLAEHTIRARVTCIGLKRRLRSDTASVGRMTPNG